MTRRRFVQDPVTFKLVEITEDRNPDRRVGDASMWGDRHYDGLQTTDGHDISSRAKHRQYMKDTGQVTFDDYKETFAKQQQERDAYHRGERPSITRADIERSIHQLMRR